MSYLHALLSTPRNIHALHWHYHSWCNALRLLHGAEAFLTGNRFSNSQEIPLILWDPKVHYCTYKCPSPVPILSTALHYQYLKYPLHWHYQSWSTAIHCQYHGSCMHFNFTDTTEFRTVQHERRRHAVWIWSNENPPQTFVHESQP